MAHYSPDFAVSNEELTELTDGLKNIFSERNIRFNLQYARNIHKPEKRRKGLNAYF